MITNDVVNFVKNDLKIFGFSILLFLVIFILYFIFKDLRWIILCLTNCIYALVMMIGVVSLLNWKVTVISSNFISLQLIFTMA